MAEYDLRGQVAAFEDHFPYNMEDRLARIDLPTEAVECFAASLEDLVVSKLASGRDTDAADIRSPGVLGALDWTKLAAAAGETKLNCLNDRIYGQFRHNYQEYLKENGPCVD